MALSRIVSETQWDIGCKSQIFGTPPLFDSLLGVIPLEFHSLVRSGRTINDVATRQWKRLMVRLAERQVGIRGCSDSIDWDGAQKLRKDDSVW